MMISLFDKIRFRLQDHCESGDCRKFCHECDFKTALRIVDEVEAEYGNGKTNADNIRSMSDEELAEFLIYSEENYKLFTSDGKDFYTYEEALKHEIDWLKSPAD